MKSNREIFNTLEVRLRRSMASCLIFTDDDYLDITARRRLLMKHIREMATISKRQGFVFQRDRRKIFFTTKQRAKELLN